MNGSNKELQYIPVVFITDNNFIMQTGVAINSLVRNKRVSTKYDIFVVAAECEDNNISMLRAIELNGCRLSIVNVALDKYKDINQLAHIPIACLLKFDICDLVEAYDKIIYLDGDIVVRDDLSDLYSIDLGDSYIAGVPSVEMVFSNERLINAGIMLFNAKKMRDDKMSERLVETRKSLGDRKSMDQQTFNLLMKDTIKFLPLKYNFIADKIVGTEKGRFKLSELNSLYQTNYQNKKDMFHDAVIIHFATGGKPWKYTFVKGSKEWYQYFLSSPFKELRLNRRGYMTTHCGNAITKFRKEGIGGIVKRIADIIESKLGKNHYSDWG